MLRTCIPFLKEWLHSSDRKPLVIRGARQVGKTWVVRYLAESEGKVLIEVNLEDRPELAMAFSSNDPSLIIRELGAAFYTEINPNQSILFFDEIQVYPELFAKLRWFAEKMPQIPVIAAGSLLDIVLANHSFSMPVGRIEFMYLEPFSFEEFQIASGKGQLVNYLKTFSWSGEPLSPLLHEQSMKDFKEYILIGGMPKAVSSWTEHHSLERINKVHHNLIGTYRADFAKYSGRMPTERLDDVIMKVPQCLGEKFVYKKVDPTAPIHSIKKALRLLCEARVCHCIFSTAANGLPLAAEKSEKFIKVILVDVGLCSAALGLSLNTLTQAAEITLINSGGIAEQVAGQLLRTINPFYIEPSLYYWQRANADAEIDYIIQHRNLFVPIEVKAGKSGTLKSLHLFMGLRHFPIAVRINSNPPDKSVIRIQDSEGNNMEYTLISVPFYLIGELHRLLDEALQKM